MPVSSSPASSSSTEKPTSASRAATTQPELPAPTTMSAAAGNRQQATGNRQQEVKHRELTHNCPRSLKGAIKLIKLC